MSPSSSGTARGDTSSGCDVTRLLRAAQAGDKEAEATLLRLMYPELRRLARYQMRHERKDHTLQPTALVHEAYLRLTLQQNRTWEGRRHFLARAAHVMRQVLVDHARGRSRLKRGGGEVTRLSHEEVAAEDFRPAELLELDECLNRLTQIDPRQARIVEMRFFVGFSIDEVAQELGLSAKTIKRDWSVARAWLYREMRRKDEAGSRRMGEG